MVLTLESDMNTIKGISFMSIKKTPGLALGLKRQNDMRNVERYSPYVMIVERWPRVTQSW
jgi:hypothetical protein